MDVIPYCAADQPARVAHYRRIGGTFLPPLPIMNVPRFPSWSKRNGRSESLPFGHPPSSEERLCTVRRLCVSLRIVKCSTKNGGQTEETVHRGSEWVGPDA